MIIPAILFGQKTKKITNREGRSDKEIFCVLKSDKTIKHGNYKRLGCKGEVVVSGFYKTDLKTVPGQNFLVKGITKKAAR
jgi:hypothetical protein